MYVKKGTTTVDIYITVKTSEYGGEDELFFGVLQEEPSKTQGCLKLKVDLPEGFWAAFEVPIVEGDVKVTGLTQLVSGPVVEEVEL